MKSKITAFDPGKSNFAYASVTADAKIAESGIMNFPIMTLKSKELKSHVKSFGNEIKTLLSRCNPNVIIIERYQSRHKGLNNEIINIAIGILLQSACNRNCEVSLLTAAAWKNALKKEYGINTYEKIMEALPKHIGDCVCMGAYYFEKICNKKIFSSILSNIGSLK